MLLYAKDTGIVYSIVLAKSGDGDYIQETEHGAFPERVTEYGMECFASDEAGINTLMERWGKRVRSDTALPNGAELSCSAYVQAEGMDTPIWIVVMPSI